MNDICKRFTKDLLDLHYLQNTEAYVDAILDEGLSCEHIPPLKTLHQDYIANVGENVTRKRNRTSTKLDWYHIELYVLRRKDYDKWLLEEAMKHL